MRSGIGGAEQRGRQRQHDVLPVGKDPVPLEQHHRCQLAHGRRHVAQRTTDLAHHGAQTGTAVTHACDLGGQDHRLAHTARSEQNRRCRKTRADHERGDGDVRNMMRVGGILVHAHPHQQWRCEVGQRLRQAGERALREIAQRPLRRCQHIAHQRTVRLHGHVVGRIQHPQQAHRHPQRGTERHRQQAQAAYQRAQHHVRHAPAPTRHRAVAPDPHERLQHQAGNGPGQPQVRQVGVIGAQVVVDRAHVALLQPEAVLHAEKSGVQRQDAHERKRRNGRRHAEPWASMRLPVAASHCTLPSLQSIVTLHRSTPQYSSRRWPIRATCMLQCKIAIDCIAAYYCAPTAGHTSPPREGTMQASVHHHP